MAPVALFLLLFREALPYGRAIFGWKKFDHDENERVVF